MRPCASCTVATPSAASASTIARSVRGVLRTTTGTVLLRAIARPVRRATRGPARAGGYRTSSSGSQGRRRAEDECERHQQGARPARARSRAEQPRADPDRAQRAHRLPLPTVHRLSGELVAWGALEREPRGPFRIGLRLWEVAALAPRSLGLRERAMPFLEDLFEVTRQNVQLAVLDGHEAVYVERLSARGAVGVVDPGRWPAAACTRPAVGQVLLAHAPVELQEAVLAGPLRALTAGRRRPGPSCAACWPRCGGPGVAVCEGQVELKSLSIAAPGELRRRRCDRRPVGGRAGRERCNGVRARCPRGRARDLPGAEPD